MSKGLVFLLFIVVLCAQGCERDDDILIPEDKMVDVIADLNLSDQIIRKYPAVYRDSIRELLTQSLLKIHNLTQEQLDTNLYLYQLDLERYRRVSENVLRKLEAKQDSLTGNNE